MALLDVKGLSKSFGGVKAVDGLSFDVGEQSILGLIGPNGSGKTTIFNLIAGVLRPDEGEIHFQGMPVVGLRPHQIARKGLGITFQMTGLFGGMTVIENMMAAALHTTSDEADKAKKLLDFLEIGGLANELAANLSFGQQKLLELARIFMLDPKLVLLDEPTAGINPVLANTMLQRILKLRDEGKTFVIIEHNMKVISKICDRTIALASGKKIAEGTPEEVRSNKEVAKAYSLV